MKKLILVILVMTMAMCILAGCGANTTSDNAGNDKLQIVTTIFPEYDWVMNILGDNPAGAEVTLLLDNGVDLHSYQPDVNDIMKISTCDVFIYVGGESDEWVNDALEEAVNKDMIVIDLLDELGENVKEEEIVEGMQGEEEEEAEEGEEEPEYDEHVWLSLDNALILTQAISNALQSADPDNAKTYETNASEYAGKLTALNEEYKNAVKEGSKDTLLFGDRFPFRYLTDDLDLKYYAAFVGCSAETEASFETITFLASKADELNLNAVMTIDGSDQKIAQTIVDNTKNKDKKILTLDSMQSVKNEDIEKGTTYLSVMEDNLAVLREALK